VLKQNGTGETVGVEVTVAGYKLYPAIQAEQVKKLPELPAIAVAVHVAHPTIPVKVVDPVTHEIQTPLLRIYPAEHVVHVIAAEAYVQAVQPAENPVAEVNPTPVTHEAHNPVAVT